MRNLKFSFALVIAIMAVGITFASKANRIGSRVVTACFEQVQLISNTGALFSPSVNQSCTTVNSLVAANNYLWLNAVPATQITGCSPLQQTFCCIEFDVDPAAPAIVPIVTPQPGYAAGKYKIVSISGVLQIKCRP